MEPKWFPNHSKMIQNDSKMIPKSCKNYPNMIPKMSRNASKMIPKSSQNAFKIGVPKNMRFFIDFCSIFAAYCKSRTSKFVRPAIVLLMFHKNRRFAFRMRFGFEKCPKNPPKTRSEPFKNRCQKRVTFQHRFFRVGPRFWSLMGLQDGAKLAKNHKILKR